MPNFLSSEEVKPQVCFLGHSLDAVGLGQIVGDIYGQEFETLNHLHFSTCDANWGMYINLFPEVNDQLLGLADVEGEVVVMTPCY